MPCTYRPHVRFRRAARRLAFAALCLGAALSCMPLGRARGEAAGSPRISEAASALPSVDERPNVLLILTDDQGWGDVHSHGNPQIDTPTMDRLAAQGARFERFFVSPMCAPTRASLLTGRWNLRTGVSWVSHGEEILPDDDRVKGAHIAAYAPDRAGDLVQNVEQTMDAIMKELE